MGFDLAMARNGIEHVYKAASEAKENGADQLSAARKAAEKDGNVSGMEESFILTLEKDPRLLERVYIDGDDLIIKDFNNMNYQYPLASTPVNQNLEFIDIEETPFKEMKTSFNQEFSVSNVSHFEPDNTQLINKLKNIAKALDSDPKSKEKLTNYAINMAINVSHPDNEDLEASNAENRTMDFLSVFDKIKADNSIGADDLKIIQTFIFMDTDYGRLLHKKSGESGIDGIYGPRTNFALNQFLKEQNIK
jgi:hypothetical protein